MFVDLTQEELKKILIEKFGEGTFKINYFETNENWTRRTGKKVSDFQSREELETVEPLQNFQFIL